MIRAHTLGRVIHIVRAHTWGRVIHIVRAQHGDGDINQKLTLAYEEEGYSNINKRTHAKNEKVMVKGIFIYSTA